MCVYLSAPLSGMHIVFTHTAGGWLYPCRAGISAGLCFLVCLSDKVCSVLSLYYNFITLDHTLLQLTSCNNNLLGATSSWGCAGVIIMNDCKPEGWISQTHWNVCVQRRGDLPRSCLGLGPPSYPCTEHGWRTALRITTAAGLQAI